jgi:hypothetical protein
MEFFKGFYFNNMTTLKDLILVLFQDYSLNIDFSFYFLIFNYLFAIIITLAFILEIKEFISVKMVGSSGSTNNSQGNNNSTGNSAGVGNGSNGNSDDKKKKLFLHLARKSGYYQSSKTIFDCEVHRFYLGDNNDKFLCSREAIRSNFKTLFYKFDLYKNANPNTNLDFRMLSKMYVASFKRQPYGTEYVNARNFLINQINSAATNSNTELLHLERGYKEITTALINNRQAFDIYQKIIDETIEVLK